VPLSCLLSRTTTLSNFLIVITLYQSPGCIHCSISRGYSLLQQVKFAQHLTAIKHKHLANRQPTKTVLIIPRVHPWATVYPLNERGYHIPLHLFITTSRTSRDAISHPSHTSPESLSAKRLLFRYTCTPFDKHVSGHVRNLPNYRCYPIFQ
jgi:hypothetical protein